jgi:hypothetical protein
MRANHVSSALRDRLGHDATVGLVDFVETADEASEERMLTIALERFERRLAEEMGAFRVALVREIHEGRTETIKWAFVFWVGQLAAFAGLLALMFRLTGR